MFIAVIMCWNDREGPRRCRPSFPPASWALATGNNERTRATFQHLRTGVVIVGKSRKQCRYAVADSDAGFLARRGTAPAADRVDRGDHGNRVDRLDCLQRGSSSSVR